MEALGYVLIKVFAHGVNKKIDKQPAWRYHAIIHPRDEKMFEFQAVNRWKLSSGLKN